jgi:RecG-like helicase
VTPDERWAFDGADGISVVGSNDPFTWPAATTPIARVGARDHVVVEGDVTATAITKWVGGSVLEVTVDDGTGALVIAFFGREAIRGLEPGRRVATRGTVLRHCDRLVVLNPVVWITTCTSSASGSG